MPRITGRFGTLTIGGVAIADLFNWTLEFEVEFAEAAIKGEVFNTGAIGGFTGRVTAERFVNSSNGAGAGVLTLATLVVSQSAAGTGVSGGIASGVGPGSEVTYVLDQLSGGGANLATITGVGVVRRGTLTAPRDLANDTFEIQMNSVPVVT